LTNPFLPGVRPAGELFPKWLLKASFLRYGMIRREVCENHVTLLGLAAGD
jgi:hypothetical protein